MNFFRIVFNNVLKLYYRFENFIIFIIGGGVGALTNWLISFFLTSIIGAHYIISYSIAQIVNIAINFIWHSFITFKVKNKFTARFLKFILMSISTASLSISLVYLVKEYILDNIYKILIFGKNLNYLITIIMITFIISILNYFISKLVIFNND